MAGKTDIVYLSGKAKWVRTQTPDKYGKYGLVLYPDEPSLLKIHKMKEEGIKNVLKKDDDGYNMTFSRPQNITVRGSVKGLTPPEVLGKDNLPLRELVGNGSDVTIKLEYYGGPTPIGGKYKAARLLAVKVDNLVPFNQGSYTDEQKELVKGLDEQPEPMF